MKPLLLLVLFTLAACGADGAPETPKTGATLDGEVSIGVQG